MNSSIIVFGTAQDHEIIRALASRLRESGYSTEAYLLDDDDPQSWSGGVLDALQNAQISVFAHSSAANDSAAVAACVSTVFRKRKTIIPFRLDQTPYTPELDYCLGPTQHIDASSDLDSAEEKLVQTVSNLLHPIDTTPRRSYANWFVAVSLAVLVAVAWRFFGPPSKSGFAISLEPFVESSLDVICEDYVLSINTGRVQVVMLDCVTGDYTAFERLFVGGKAEKASRNLARKNAVLSPYDTDRLMIPVLAAIAMRQAGVNRSVALGEDNWNNAHLADWNAMLGEEPLVRGLSALHLSTTLHGKGVAANARRYSVTPYHMLQGLLGIVGEAYGSPGFDYCGGRENAMAILTKMKYDDGLGLLTGALLRDWEEDKDSPSCACRVAGAVNFDDPCCMLFVNLEASAAIEDFNVADEALSLWHTLGTLAKAADEEWGGNGR